MHTDLITSQHGATSLSFLNDLQARWAEHACRGTHRGLQLKRLTQVPELRRSAGPSTSRAALYISAEGPLAQTSLTHLRRHPP